MRLHTAVEQAQGSQASIPLAEVRVALQSLENLSHRTERLLQLSRAEGGDMAHFGPVNLVQLAEQVAQTFWQQPSTQKRLDWLAPESAAPIWVHGDMDGLAIVVRNLIDNALHHTDAAVELEVKSGMPATLVVRDHGRGLTPSRSHKFSNAACA